MNIKKLFKSERGTHTEMRTVRREGKTFKRKTRVGTKAPEKKAKIDVPKMSDMKFGMIAEGVKENIEYQGKDKIPEMDDDDIRTYIEDFAPEEYSYELGTSKLRDEFIERTLIEFKSKYLNKSEMIDVMKLMRGTHKEKVPVKRETGTKYEYRRVGKKESSRKGTGKMNKFPESIKKEILEQRSFGESGAKIKIIIENLIDTMSTNDQTKMESLGLIDEKNKLTVTNQALTDWAKKQGIESIKKRTSAVETEKVKHQDTKKELDRADRKIAELEVKSKHNLDEIKLVQQSKQESDRIRQQLGKDNINLKSKLKACLAGDKNDT